MRINLKAIKYQKILSLFLVVLSLFVFTPRVEAAALSTLSDTMTREKPSTNSDHTLVFTTPTGLTSGQTMVITFPDGSVNGFVGGASIDYTDVDFMYGATNMTLAAAPTGTTMGALFSGTYRNVLTFTNGTQAVSGGTVITVKIGTVATSQSTGVRQIANPNTSGSKIITVGGGTFADSGSIAIPIITSDDQVVVSASVDPTITFSLSTTTAALNTMTTAAVATASDVTLTMGTNAAGGYIVTIMDVGSGASPGLYKSSAPTKLIASANATLAGGTEGYGVKGVAGTGSPTVSYATGATDQVVALATTATSFCNYNSPTGATNQTAIVRVKAAISASTPAGSYADTITLIMTGNF